MLDIEFAKAIELDKTGRTQAALDTVYNIFDDYLLDGKFADVDTFLEKTQPLTLSANLIIGLLSITLPASRHLPARQSFFTQSWVVLEERGRDAKRLLSGLERWIKFDGSTDSVKDN